MNAMTSILTCCCVLIHWTGCATTGAERTPLSSWSRQTFDKLGFSVILPQQSGRTNSRYYMDVADSEEYEKSTGRKDIILCCHPVWPGSIFSEPIYLMKIRLLVFRPGKAVGYTIKAFPKNYYPEFTSTNGIVMNRGQGVECKLFRKDLMFTNGNTVICEAEIMAPLVGSDQYAVDTNAITRVFTSIHEL